MLVGSIKYRDEDLGELTFATYAKHSVSKIAFHIMQSDLDKNTSFLEYDAKYMKVLDKTRDESGNIVAAFKDGVEWEIKGEKTNVTAPTERDIVVNTASNKVATNVGNMDLAVRLGAIIAYCKQNAQGRISEDDEFSDILKGHLDNKSDSKYKDITVTCDIVYKQSEIIKLDIESKYFSIHLDYADEQNLSVAYFKPLKQKDKWGNPLSITPIKNVTVKMTENTLGWKIEQKIKQTVSIMGMYQRIEDVIAAHPEKNTDWILDRKYEIVTDDNLEEVIKEFMDYDGYIAFDTETTGLKINFLSREGRGDQLVGCVLSMKPGTGYYFPVKHKYIKNLCNGDDNFFMQHYMKPILEGKKIVTHNCKYDWKVAYIYGIVVNVVYDTMIALGVTKRYEILNFELGLKSLAHSLLGLDMFDLDDFIIGDNEWGDDGAITFADLPYELVRRYAPADGDMTLSLMQYIEKNHIIENYNAAEVFQLEVEFSKVVAYSEFWGYHIDVEGIPELQKKIMGEMEKHQQAAFEIAGHEFNMNSPIQLNKVMYDELGIEQVEGKKGTDKNILKILSEMEDENGEPKYPFVKHLKAYRDAEAIYKNFLKKLHIFATDDGYIFPDVLFLGTETGRCSVKNPNYQSYNDTVKHYVVPRKGYIMGDSDFGQIEYRTLASMAEEKTLIEAFDDPDLDYHQYQASRMFNVPYAAVTKKLRQQSKGINFGLPYGMGDASLGARIFGQRTPENTKKAAALREKFFEGQDHIRAFFDKVRAGGVANGYTETLKHRRRYYHKGKFSEAEIRRQAGNHAIQGSAADIYKMAVVRFFQFIMGNGLRDKVLIDAFIHDEILFEIHESVDVLWLTTEWRKAFEVPLEGFCKLYAGLGYGKCWYDAKKQDLPTGFITALCELALDKSRPLKDDIFTNVDPNTGYVWHNDIEQFIKDVKFWFNNYKFQRVFDYVQEEDKQGAIIKPAIWSLLTECVSELIPIELQQRNKDDKGREYCMQLIDRIEKEVGQGIINFDILDNKCTIKCRDLQEYIKVFCIYKEIDYTKVNILAPDGVKDSTKVEAKDDVQRDKEEVIKQVNTFDLFHELLKSDNYEFDIFTDNESRLLYVNADDTIILNMVKEKAIKNPKGYDMSTLYKIMLVVRKPTPAEADTNCFIRLSDINAINWQYNMAKSMMGVKKNGNS